MPQWVKGQTGNPKGRTPSAIARTAEIRKTILGNAEQFVEALIKAAIAGDVTAGRTLLAVVCPSLKPIESPVKLDLPTDGDLREVARHILGAMAAGRLAPGPASQMINSLSNLARLVELDALENRIAALESRDER